MVWFVDDDEIILSLLKAIISRNCENVNYRFYSDPNQAYIDFINGVEKPEKLVLDVNMPVLSGPQFLDLISVIPKEIMTTKVFMLTSSIRTEDYDNCMRFEFVHDFLIKPFKMDDFKRLGICIQNKVAVAAQKA